MFYFIVSIVLVVMGISKSNTALMITSGLFAIASGLYEIGYRLSDLNSIKIEGAFQMPSDKKEIIPPTGETCQTDK